MSPKKKKNLKRRRHNKHTKNDATSTTVHTKLPLPEVTNKPVLSVTKKQGLSLIEKFAKVLKADDSLKLVHILERIFSVFTDNSHKRSAKVELIDQLLTNVKDYNVSNMKNLKMELNSIFLPKELKELIVEPKDLKETCDFLTLLFLGVGCFNGDGYLNKARRIKVHIKEPNFDEDRLEIIHEAKILSQLRHNNIVRILAFDKQGPRFAIEYMKLGNLLEALGEYTFTDDKLITIIKGVISAMIYIGERRYVLRNLVCQNISLDASGKCKICDFQYCQRIDESTGEYVDPDTDLPVNFAAPEVRDDGRYSFKSDVWDAGLLIWEMYLLHRDSNLLNYFSRRLEIPLLLYRFVKENILPIPGRMPTLLNTCVRKCLLPETNNRPTFVDIENVLQEL